MQISPGMLGYQTVHMLPSAICNIQSVSTKLCKVQVPNFHKLSAISLLAAVMSISYSTIAIGVSAHAGRQPGAEYNLNGFTKAEGVFGIFNALGTIAFAYGGHNVVLEIQVGRLLFPSCFFCGLLLALCLLLIVDNRPLHSHARPTDQYHAPFGSKSMMAPDVPAVYHLL